MTEPLPTGTAWAYGTHVFVSIWDAAPMDTEQEDK